MGVMIRLARYGCTNRPFFHIVAINSSYARNSPKKFEQLGTYDPMPNVYNEKLVAINFERVQFWIARGAQPSRPVSMLLGLSGFYPINPVSVVIARRARLLAAKKAQEAADAAAQAELEEANKESGEL